MEGRSTGRSVGRMSVEHQICACVQGDTYIHKRSEVTPDCKLPSVRTEHLAIAQSISVAHVFRVCVHRFYGRPCQAVRTPIGAKGRLADALRHFLISEKN